MTRPRQHNQEKERAALKLVRTAIYTRKSTEHGLDQEFNSLDAQREACEAYIASQRHEGWTALPDRYDDGGFTGANTDRPGLRRLLADIEAGRVDLVVVYKLDRLSRSLLDFAGMMKELEARGVGLVSITQAFNSQTSTGRLMLNVLLSFSQFEREIIAERTRDKVRATRRKGLWTGGQPVLGYDVDAARTRLVVNEVEAEQVRGIFGLYIEHESLLPVVRELKERGWVNKQRITRKGQTRGGKSFTRTSLYRLLVNPVYAGKTKYRDELHQGEHPAIIDAKDFARVQALLQHNGLSSGSVRNDSGALLKGLLTCGACGSAMTPSHTRKGQARYRYYRCSSTILSGKDACANGSVGAGQIEQVVIDRIRALGRDPALRAEVLRQAKEQADARATELAGEERSLGKDLAAWTKDLLKLSALLRPGEDNGDVVPRLAELQARIGQVEARVRKVKQQLAEVNVGLLDETQATEALSLFDPVWQELSPREQARVVALLVEQVVYDGTRGRVTITFHPAGIKSLAEELADKQMQQQRA